MPKVIVAKNKENLKSTIKEEKNQSILRKSLDEENLDDIFSETTMISWPAGWKENCIRYFVTIQTKDKKELTEFEQTKIAQDFLYTLLDYKSEIENIQWTDTYGTLTVLLDINYTIDEIILEAIDLVNSKKNILIRWYQVTNNWFPERKEILENAEYLYEKDKRWLLEKRKSKKYYEKKKREKRDREAEIEEKEILNKPLPTEYDGKKLEKMKFKNDRESFEYGEMMVDAYYELKDAYQKLVEIYQTHGENLKIEQYMFKEESEQKNDEWDIDLPF